MYFSETDHYYKSWHEVQEGQQFGFSYYPNKLDKKVKRDFKLSFDYYKEKIIEFETKNNKGENTVHKEIQKHETENFIISEKRPKEFASHISSLVYERGRLMNEDLFNFIWLSLQSFIETMGYNNLIFFNTYLNDQFEDLKSKSTLINTNFLRTKLKPLDKNGVNDFLETFNRLILWYSKFKLRGIKYEKYGEASNLERILDELKVETIKDFFEQSELLKETYLNYLDIIGDIKIFEKDEKGNIFGSRVLIDDHYNKIKFLYQIGKEVKDFFMNQIDFDYLEAVKANAQRIYLRQWQGSTLNELLEDFRKMVETDKLSHENYNNETKSNIPYSPGEEFINKWFGKEGFEIGESFKVINHAYGVEIKITKKGKELDFADLGYGSIQLLALLLKIVLTESKVLMLEEPEIHLHPDLQSKLADMFRDAHIRFGISFIIETHSEYIIRKFQYLTVKKEIKPNDVVINYFTDPEELKEGEEQVREIRIKENGSLTGEFGSGFFDEADNLAMKLFLMTDDTKN